MTLKHSKRFGRGSSWLRARLSPWATVSISVLSSQGNESRHPFRTRVRVEPRAMQLGMIRRGATPHHSPDRSVRLVGCHCICPWNYRTEAASGLGPKPTPTGRRRRSHMGTHAHAHTHALHVFPNVTTQPVICLSLKASSNDSKKATIMTLKQCDQGRGLPWDGPSSVRASARQAH